MNVRLWLRLLKRPPKDRQAREARTKQAREEVARGAMTEDELREFRQAVKAVAVQDEVRRGNGGGTLI